RLEFSLDTVLFDTVFTTVGSTTQRLKVFNRNSDAVLISNIFLQSGTASNFRINVDGVARPQVRDVELRGNDSLFIFVEVTVDPNGLTTPLIVTDQLVFETNGNVQDVDLVAWGQDAYFYPSVVFEAGVTHNLPSDKPNVFYGIAIVDSAATLNIDAGSRLHFHAGAGLIVLQAATLKVRGQLGNEVVFEGDRLESVFSDEPNQWGITLNGRIFGGIWLSATSRDHEIDYAIIKNGNIGLQVDTIGNTNGPTLTLRNTIIQNMTNTALVAQGSNVLAENCVFANCGRYTAALAIGGTYEFRHCTFANYWRFSNRDDGLLLLNNFFTDTAGVVRTRALVKADFINCVLYGNLDEELEFDPSDEDPETNFNFRFDHCILRTEEDTDDPGHYVNVLVNPGSVFVDGILHDPVFNDFANNDYRLFAQSVALGAGRFLPTLINDLEGNVRMDPPDLGAYEFVP
ncbi:MAG: hypothetical protein AAGB22_06730, partial [Bacteroidota bacterium]